MKPRVPTIVRKASSSNFEVPKYFIWGFMKSEKAIEHINITKMCQKVLCYTDCFKVSFLRGGFSLFIRAFMPIRLSLGLTVPAKAGLVMVE